LPLCVSSFAFGEMSLSTSKTEIGIVGCGNISGIYLESDTTFDILEIVVNLTNPQAHAEVSLQAVEAGKSVYNEKPLTVTREEGWALLDAANRRGVRVGGAPDTFFGGGLQTCRKLIDDGWIGEPIGATAFIGIERR
jgi:predicted dehydrogenase